MALPRKSPNRRNRTTVTLKYQCHKASTINSRRRLSKAKCGATKQATSIRRGATGSVDISAMAMSRGRLSHHSTAVVPRYQPGHPNTVVVLRDRLSRHSTMMMQSRRVGRISTIAAGSLQGSERVVQVVVVGMSWGCGSSAGAMSGARTRLA